MENQKAAAVEICTGSLEDALTAYKAGAKRIELNTALSLGGLSADPVTLQEIKTRTDLEVICMARPRAGGFAYSEIETEIMLKQAKMLLENGADGIAFGFLTEEGQIDKQKTKQMISLIKSFDKTAVFHRAFDCTPDPLEAMEILIELGADRILTSGQKQKALQGKELLKKLVKQAKGRIEILPGSGISAENAIELVEYTGVNQVHASCSSFYPDPGVSQTEVSFTFEGGNLSHTGLQKVKDLLLALQNTKQDTEQENSLTDTEQTEAH
jgi:copper homeostasis protein